MKVQQYVAAGIALIAVLWLIFPRFWAEADSAVSDQAMSSSAAGADGLPSDLFIVRAMHSKAQNFSEQIRVRGKTQVNRRVDLKAEISGVVTATPVDRGQRVKAGDIICQIDVDNREADLQEALSRRQQTKLEYEAALDLKDKNLMSAVAIAKAKSAYDSAIADVTRAEHTLNNTRIKAPFDGVLETRPVEIGDLLMPGNTCGSILDDDPMLLVGTVPESDVGKLYYGAAVMARLHTGERVQAVITYLATSAAQGTRNYRIEAELLKSEQPIREGITAELLVAGVERQAHLIPSSSLTLNDAGDIGIKLVNQSDSVEFKPVTIIGEASGMDVGGIWVSGLPDEANVITHGQEEVFVGQKVLSNYEWSTARLDN